MIRGAWKGQYSLSHSAATPLPRTASNNCMLRRALVGAAGLSGVAGLGTWAYRAAPTFWKQYSNDLKREVEAAPSRPDPKAWPNYGLQAAWLGHSTVLLKVDGFTILTDPV